MGILQHVSCGSTHPQGLQVAPQKKLRPSKMHLRHLLRSLRRYFEPTGVLGFRQKKRHAKWNNIYKYSTWMFGFQNCLPTGPSAIVLSPWTRVFGFQQADLQHSLSCGNWKTTDTDTAMQHIGNMIIWILVTTCEHHWIVFNSYISLYPFWARISGDSYLKLASMTVLSKACLPAFNLLHRFVHFYFRVWES